MTPINPRITIQNAEGSHLFVRFEHDFGNGERVDVTAAIPRGDHTLTQVHLQASARLQTLLDTLDFRVGEGRT
jgi:hypothetical protein